MTSQDVLDSPPFVAVEGVINIRALGGYSIPTGPHPVVLKPGILYRSGEISGITSRGVEQLRALGIRTIFDFRSNAEIAMHQSASPALNEIKIISVPIFREGTFNPENIVHILKNYEERELETFIKEYVDILTLAGPTIEAILRHILSHPEEPCLIHCTAGKDRTGVIAALMLMLLGVGDEEIIQDYALTTVGLEPAIPLLKGRLSKHQVFVDNPQGTLNMGSSRPETMRGFLAMVRERFGDAQKYIRDYTTVTSEEISDIKRSLVIN